MIIICKRTKRVWAKIQYFEHLLALFHSNFRFITPCYLLELVFHNESQFVLDFPTDGYQLPRSNYYFVYRGRTNQFYFVRIDCILVCPITINFIPTEKRIYSVPLLNEIEECVILERYHRGLCN